MEVEALHSSIRHTHARRGGCCTAPCGNLQSSPIDLAIVNALDSQSVVDLRVAYPLINILRQRFPKQSTVGEVRVEMARRAREKALKTAAEKSSQSIQKDARDTQGSLRNPRFTKEAPRMRLPRQLTGHQGRSRPTPAMMATSAHQQEASAAARQRSAAYLSLPLLPRPASSSSGASVGRSASSTSSGPRKPRTAFSQEEDETILKLREEKNRTFEDIAILLNTERPAISIETRYKLLTSPAGVVNREYTSEEDEKIKKYRRKGLSWEVIGEKLERKTKSVKNRWQRIKNS